VGLQGRNIKKYALPVRMATRAIPTSHTFEINGVKINGRFNGVRNHFYIKVKETKNRLK
jgi:hypothetical protein